MSTWSGIRKKLESEYLAESLRGHISYFATSYSRSHDHEGRAAIRYDGKEIIKGCYYYNWTKADLFPEDEKYEKRMKEEFANQSIEKSLCSENLLVRIFAVLDRRVGKRKLLILKENIENESDSFKEFFAIRIRAEGIE